MANIGATFSMIAISVIFIVAIIGVFQIQSFQSNYNAKFKDIVDQLNVAQQREIDFDRRSKQRVDTVINDASQFNSSFVTNDAVAKGVTSQSLNVYGSLKADKNSVQANDIVFASRWSGYPNQLPNQAFIANDTELNKKLMIVGNKSDGSGDRKVGVWDKLDVHGNLGIDRISSAHSVIARERVGGEGGYMDKDGNIYSKLLIEGENIQGRDAISVGNGAAYMRKDGNVYANKNLVSESTIDGQNIVGTNMVKVSNDAAWMKNDGTFSGRQVCLGGTCINKTELQKIKDMSAPSDCSVSAWTPWSLCTKPCGTGSQYRIRNVLKNAANGGAPCPSLIENQECNKQACGTDCVVSNWSAWTTCTRTCGGGSRSRTRTVVSQPQNGGAVCPELQQFEICNPQPCVGPQPCIMSDWSAFGSCTKTCGGGTMTRTRYVTQPAINGGTACGSTVDEVPCNTNPCPQDCVMSDWSDWNTCSASCGGGTQTRTRSIVTQPTNGGRECPKTPDGQIYTLDTRTCNTDACANLLMNVQINNGIMSSSGFSSYFSIMSTDTGLLYSWGTNANGELGDRTNIQKTWPVPIATLPARALAIASGFYHNLLLTSTGVLYAWGLGNNGRLGDGTTTSKNTPVVVGSLTNAIKIACGRDHSVAVTRTGQVYAWGYNWHGQLGDNTQTERATPTLITAISSVVGIACGANHTVAFTTSGQLYSWGLNSYGQLGDTTTLTRLLPTLISVPLVTANTRQSVVALACGEHHTMALVRTDNTNTHTLFTWGYNVYGQLGNGNATPRYSPVDLPSISFPNISGNIIGIACSVHSSYAITSSGQLYSWGWNNNGQLGDGTTANKSTPTLISGITNVTSISCGEQHVVASTRNNKIYTWGVNGNGQLGNVTLNRSLSPIIIFEYSFRLAWINFTNQTYENNGQVICFVYFPAKQVSTITISNIPQVDYAVSASAGYTFKYFDAYWGTGNIGLISRMGSTQPAGNIPRGTPTPSSVSFSPNATITWFALLYNYDVTSSISNPMLSIANFNNIGISY